MIYINSSTISTAWREACVALYDDGNSTTGNAEIFRDESVIIEIENKTNNSFKNIIDYDESYPMSKIQIERISHYLVSGKNEDEVSHEWTKLYRSRLFEGEINQVCSIVDYLKRKPFGKRAQASVWNQETDLTSEIAPCLQVVWFQVVDNNLVMHVHMRASDCYGKLLMNLHEFVSLQWFVANSLNIGFGKFLFFVDYCHFNATDAAKVQDLVASFRQEAQLAI